MSIYSRGWREGVSLGERGTAAHPRVSSTCAPGPLGFEIAELGPGAEHEDLLLATRTSCNEPEGASGASRRFGSV